MMTRKRRSLNNHNDIDDASGENNRCSCRVKKRSRRKVSTATRSIRTRSADDVSTAFLNLVDDAFIQIVSFLVPIDPTNNTGDGPINVNDARRIWSFFGTLSIKFQKRIKEVFLANIEADFYAVKERNYYSTFLFLANNRFKITKLRIRTEIISTNLVAMVLHKCDTSNLESVEVKVTTDKFGRITPLDEDDIGNTIDLTTTTTTKVVSYYPTKKFRWKKAHGMIVKQYIDRQPMSIHELHKEIALHCPTIRNLKINAWAIEDHREILHWSKKEISQMHYKNVNLDDALSSLRTLRQVELSIGGAGLQRDRYRYGPQLIRSFLRCAEKMEGLETLVLSMGGDAGFFGCRQRVRIKSKSLRVIDVTNCSKLFWITKCLCPSLERFICKGYLYGNGVRECDPKEVFERGVANIHGIFTAGSKKFYGLCVPDSCSVELV